MDFNVELLRTVVFTPDWLKELFDSKLIRTLPLLRALYQRRTELSLLVLEDPSLADDVVYHQRLFLREVEQEGMRVRRSPLRT